eukprot:UN00395
MRAEYTNNPVGSCQLWVIRVDASRGKTTCHLTVDALSEIPYQGSFCAVGHFSEDGETCIPCQEDPETWQTFDDDSACSKQEMGVKDTTGTCAFFGCDASHGPTECTNGQCTCKTGYSALHGYERGTCHPCTGGSSESESSMIKKCSCND